MGSYILRGITTALLVTVITLLAGVIWSYMGLGGLSVSKLIDIGLLASCLIGGYRTARESKVWFLGGVAGAGYVTVGTLLLALFLPISGVGFVKVLVEGALIGLVAGAFGAGKKGAVPGAWARRPNETHFTPSFVGYSKDDRGSEFNWDYEEDYTPRTNSSNSDWLESSEDEFPRVPETRRESVIEWPWDRENENNNKNKINNNNIELTSSEFKQVRNDLVVREREEEKAKPWWEE